MKQKIAGKLTIARRAFSKRLMRTRTHRFIVSFVCCGALCCTSIFAQESRLEYPESKKVDRVDEYFGVKVDDPYQWLEEDVRVSDEVRDWVTRQSEFTRAYLDQLAYRDEIEARLTELWNYERFGTPFYAGGRYYMSKNDGLQNQDVIYRLNSLSDEMVELIDPNKWSAEGTAALRGLAFSEDGAYCAYGVAEAGSDWTRWEVLDIESGKVLDDVLRHIKFGGVHWSPDNQGFYYSRFPEPQEGAAFQSLNLNQRVYYHKLGTPQSDDILIYEDPDNPEWGFSPTVTEDGDFLILTVSKGTDSKYQIYYLPLEAQQEVRELPPFVVLIDNFDNEYSFIGNVGSKFFFKTDYQSPLGSVIAIDGYETNPEKWQVIVPEAKESLQTVSLVNHSLICSYLRDAKTAIVIYDLDGNFVRNVDFPGIGSAVGFGGKKKHTETFYSYSSFATPPSIYRYDMLTGESQLLRRADVQFNPDDYEVKQVFYNSKDGTRVPMFIAHRKGVKLDGSNPTLLYAYGGFNISLTPSFAVTRLQWMEMGGVYALANLRGGGEYGEEWHKAGTKTKKQNVFDDFIAAAEYLIEQGYTSPQHLGIQGGSNGGLLVGAVMCQRPDLFGACLPAVGVMDMLKFQNWTAGRYWVDDYGSSANNAEEFIPLYPFSPSHNLKPTPSSPPPLGPTADTDDRVVPGHSFKFAARLQEYHVGPNPVLIRIEVSAGHGAGTPTSKRIAETADLWAFLTKHLGLNPNFPGRP